MWPANSQHLLFEIWSWSDNVCSQSPSQILTLVRLYRGNHRLFPNYLTKKHLPLFASSVLPWRQLLTSDEPHTSTAYVTHQLTTPIQGMIRSAAWTHICFQALTRSVTGKLFCNHRFSSYQVHKKCLWWPLMRSDWYPQSKASGYP